MKLQLTIFLIITVSLIKAQDTILVNNNFKYKLGIKPCTEASADISQRINSTNIYWQAYRAGIQFIRKIKKSNSSIETGIYYTTKAKEYSAFHYFPYGYSRLIINSYYLSVPINYRYDTKVIYVAGGLFCDYLIDHSDQYLINSIYDYGVDRKFNVGYNFAIGVEKQINRTINFYVEGLLFHTVSWPKISDSHSLIEGNLKTTYRNYGVAVGVNYKFLNQDK